MFHLKMSHYFMLQEGCVLYTFVVFVIWNTNRKCKQWTFLSNFPWLCCDPFLCVPVILAFQMIIKWVCFVHLLIEKGPKKRLSTTLANENITCLSTDFVKVPFHCHEKHQILDFKQVIQSGKKQEDYFFFPWSSLI